MASDGLRGAHGAPSARGRSRGPSTRAAPDRLDERTLLAVLTSFKKGDFSARLPLEWTGSPAASPTP